jgi:hypothetical protein
MLIWADAADDVYRRIVSRVPDAQRSLVEAPLRRGSESRAGRRAPTAVTEADVIVAFFDVTPEAFHSQVIANLTSLGIDYRPYLGASPSQPVTRTDLGRLMADLKSMSAIAEVPFDALKTRAVIDAYADLFQSAPVAMRTTTKPKERRDLSLRYLDMLRKHETDPLATALEKGFVKNDGHPIYAFYEETKERCGAFGFGVDLNVRSGFSKIWMAPYAGRATLDMVADIPNLPQGAKNTRDHFARHGLDSFGLFGFDFVHRTTNLYFMIKHPETPRDYAKLLADVGLTPDMPAALEACRPAHVLYYSFSWDTETVQRVCFAIVCENRGQVPTHFDPLIAKCVADAEFMQGGEKCIYSIVWAPHGHYFKIDNDYSGTMATDLVHAGVVGV